MLRWRRTCHGLRSSMPCTKHHPRNVNAPPTAAKTNQYSLQSLMPASKQAIEETPGSKINVMRFAAFAIPMSRSGSPSSVLNLAHPCRLTHGRYEVRPRALPAETRENPASALERYGRQKARPDRTVFPTVFRVAISKTYCFMWPNMAVVRQCHRPTVRTCAEIEFLVASN